MNRVVTSLAAIGLAIVLPFSANAQSEAMAMVADGKSILWVSAEGSVESEPDIATFNAAVVTTAATAAEALSANSEKMRAIFAELERLSIAERDIQTSRIGIEPVMNEKEMRNLDGVNQIPTITGYRAVNSLSITQRDLDDFGEVIDRLIAAGANLVSGPNFQLADPADEMDEARKLAVAEARRKAKLYAEAAGMRVGRILMIDDQNSSGAVRNQFGFMEAMSDSVPIAKGAIEIKSDVRIIFELAPL